MKKVEGILFIKKNRKGKFYGIVKLNDKEMPVPSFYSFNDLSLDGKKCNLEMDKGQIKKILVDGKELLKKNSFKKHKTDPAKHDRYNNYKIKNMFSINNTKLPLDTKNNLRQHENLIDNFYLKLNKCINFRFNKQKDKEEILLYKRESKNKREKIISKFEIEFNFNTVQDIIDKIKNNQNCLFKSLKEQNYNLKNIILQPESRLIVGLGNESVYETSLTLHHLYGIPYIPASSIKGMVRNYIIINLFNGMEKDAFFDKGFCDIFGCPKDSFYNKAKIGKVIFFDAFPVEKPQIDIDIINVHYPDYYTDNKPPADYQNPNPIFFLTVKDTKFKFLLGIKEKNNIIIDRGVFLGKNIFDVIYDNLKYALYEYGIGAKTSLGYGIFKVKN
ncbi:MAG: type III-B CRISPR module RAMP protein Cmr6 [Desulfonauticus sp.]|nr:type III-B CRISPR module RAMP protein Cmr6 [Desulfonauticus sp.]